MNNELTKLEQCTLTILAAHVNRHGLEYSNPKHALELAKEMLALVAEEE